jgi:peptidoglycan/LPS O-acetylase OafA/YrhL
MSTANAPAPAATRRSRLYEVDLLRVVTFTCVVFVHSYGAMNDPGFVDMSAVSLLMHYTRYSFVFITAFVLFFGYYRREDKATTFWRKRFGAVVLPYLVWSLVYTAVAFSVAAPEGVVAGAKLTVVNILTGNAWFHLYFLLVSMQFYFVFPALRWLVRRTAGHHALLLAAAFVVQAGVLSMFTFVATPANPLLAWLWSLADTVLPSYTFFCVLGALLAAHYQRVREFVLEHLRWAWAVLALGVAGTLGAYFARVADGEDAPAAGNPLHPDVLPWAIGSVLGLYMLCTWWSTRRRAGSPLASFVDFGSVRAFGVYAVHPLMIQLQWAPFHEQFTEFFGNRVFAGMAMFLTTTALSLAAVELMLRSPFAKTLVARLPVRRAA